MCAINRAIHFDFHTPGGARDFGSEFDAERFAQTLQAARVTQITMAAQCNFGYAYYQSEKGVMYPSMRTEMLSSLLEACHRHGIKVSAYINVGINNVQAQKHIEWCKIDEEGRVLRGDIAGHNASAMMCCNTGYRAFLLDIIKEILQYSVDGIFCDCISAAACFCPSCQEKMKTEGVNLGMKDAAEEFAFRSVVSLCREIRSVVPERMNLVFNGLHYDVGAALSSHLEVECLPGGFGGWGYDYMGAQTAYARNLKESVVYMSGRFHSSWGDFGGTKEKASLENDLYDALLNNVGFSIGDHLNPRGGLDESLYRTVGEIFTQAEQYERWTRGARYCAEIGVVRNKYRYNGPFLPDELRGAARILSELKYGFDIVNEDMDFSQYSVLVLPDFVDVNDTLKEKINKHIKEGKGVLSSRNSGYDEAVGGFALDGYGFLQTDGSEFDAASCYRVLDEEIDDAGVCRSVYSEGLMMRAEKEEQALARHVDHYFADRWDRPYFDYRWMTPHIYTYLPPEKESGCCVAGMERNICHIAFDIFSGYYRYAAVFHKKLIAGILKRMLPEPLIKTEKIPSTARVSLTETAQYRLLHVKVTYPEPRGRWFKIVEEHNRLPGGARVGVAGRYRSTALLPGGQRIDSRYEDGYTWLTLPEIEGYAMFLLEK